MGVDVGFRFKRFQNGKLEKANIIDDYYEDKCDYLNICGRCDATYLFVNLVEQFMKEGSYKEDAKPEDKYYSYLLFNHPELDGFEDHSGENEYNPRFRKYFYLSLEKFKSHFDFDEATRKHDATLKELNEQLVEMQQEVESIRTHQENAKTQVAFDGFTKQIEELKEEISCKKEVIKDYEEDDYDYNHYKWIKEDIERVEQIMKNDPDIVVVGYASY